MEIQCAQQDSRLFDPLRRLESRCHESLLVHLRRSIKLIRHFNRMDGIRMNRRDSFEQAYAESHDLPIETFSQYRMGDTYRLPMIAKCYRFWCMALDSVEIEIPEEQVVLPAIPGDFVRSLHRFGAERWNECLVDYKAKIKSAGLKVQN